MEKLSVSICIGVAIFGVSQSKQLTYFDPIPSVVTPTKMSANLVLPLQFFAPTGGYMPFGHLCTEGVQIALDAIQASPLLPGYDMLVRMKDSQCLMAKGVEMIMHFLRNLSAENTVPVMLGPTCESVDYVAAYLKHYNMISISAAVPSVLVYRDRKRYESLMLIRGSVESWYSSLPPFFAENGWRRIYLASDAEYITYQQQEEIMISHFPKYNLKVAGTVKFKYPNDKIPSPEEMENALKELSKMNARIVLLHATFSSLAACKIYELGLFGPEFVYLIPEPIGFVTNTPLRYENCTSKMLADVLESVIYFSWGTPARLFPDDAQDIVGMTGSELDRLLKTRIQNPDHSHIWLSFRSVCYSNVITAAVALDRMQKTLQEEQNGNLTEWLSGDSKFSRNGSYFYDKMIKLFDELKFPNLDSSIHFGLNSYEGVTGFFQPRRDRSVRIYSDVPEMFHYVPVAWYDDSNGKMERTLTYMEWRTKNRLPPLDAVRIILVKEPLIHVGIVATLFIVTTASTFTELGLTVRFLRNNKNKPQNAIATLFSYFLVGLIFTSLSTFIWPLIGATYSAIQCTIAIIVAISGMSCMTISSMLIQTICVTNLIVGNQKGLKTELGRKRKIGSGKLQGSSERANTRFKQRVLTGKMVKVSLLNEMPKSSQLAFTVYNLLQIVIVAVWFGLFPVKTNMIQFGYNVSSDDVSTVYQHFSFDCSFSKAEYFAVPLFIFYALVSIKAVHLSVSLAKAKYEEDIEYMVAPVRNTSLTVPFILAAGLVSGFSGTGIVITSSVVVSLIGLLSLVAVLKSSFFAK